jgi:protein TonB
VLTKVDPEYSEDARKAKFSGTVVLQLIVDVDGKAKNIKVTRGVGLGLDEKAVEAVQKWKFIPGRKNGQAVPVYATVEVNFRLL